MKNYFKVFCVIAFIAVIGFSMAGCSSATVPDQLVGIWSIGGTEIFRITSDGKIFISGSEYEYVIRSSSALGAASGTIVVGYANDDIGRLDYVINSGRMTISSGTAAFAQWTGLEVTGGGVSGSSASGGAVPSQLVGTWSTFDIEFFKITSDRKFSISGVDFEYDIMPTSILNAVSGTIVVGFSSNEFGRFNYQISDGKMTISNGTASLADFSGFVLTK